MNKNIKFFGYYDRPLVVGDKLSKEPCALFDVDALPPISRKEQCLRGFAVGEMTSGGSKLGAISEKDFIACKDVEEFETLLDESEDMGDCVRAYNKFKLHQYQQNEALVNERKKYQDNLKKQMEEFEAWKKQQNYTPNQNKAPEQK